MTNSIGSLTSGQAAAAAANEAASGPASGAASGTSGLGHKAQQTGAAHAGEAVTLSATSQTMAQLLEAARAADGVDQARVAQLRQAVQDGTYHVAPQDVARAISSAGIGSAPPRAAGAGGRVPSNGAS